MSKRRADEILVGSPYLRRWLQECAACHQVGHKPGCPDFGPIWWELRRLYPLLELNEVGWCEVCARAMGPAGDR